MFKQMKLQTQMMGAFITIGSIVLTVGYVGWSSNSRLSEHVNTLSKNSIVSIRGLWKVNEGQTQIQSSVRALINSYFSQGAKDAELERIQQSWRQIDEGFSEYETTPQTNEETRLYKQFQTDWKHWKQDHEAFLKLYEATQTDEKISLAELRQLSEFLANEERVSFDATTQKLLELLTINGDIANTTQALAMQDVLQTNRWISVGMILGPTVALVLGLYFSKTIAKPLGAKIAAIVKLIVSSSTEIAAAVAQQERITVQQASSVNQTTTTMDELGASSRQSANQAELATNGAKQALKLTENGTQAVERTLNEMAGLKQKVDAIAEQISHLSEQTNQIGNITNLVGDLANQTNMLALNAAVEAVRAGEQGKGFAVVASEIRKLADQSKKSADKINTLITDIRTAIDVTVMVTEEGTKTVENGVKIAEETASSFAGVKDAVNHIVLSSQQISLSSSQQAIAIQQVVDAMNELNLAARQTASGISQTKVSTEQLTQASQNLQSVV
jgi:methyl-accepting chemotaxis protein